MATNPALDNERRGFWLRMARERANLTQAAVAGELGLSSESKSTMSAWEAGTREPKLRYLKAMARLYGVALEMFTDPEPSARERIEDRLAEWSQAALRLEREDWEAGERDGAVGGAPVAQRRRRSA
ncbi:MAG: helix-turn-helix transcriptional regulator [Gemmatimonadales bacterium]